MAPKNCDISEMGNWAVHKQKKGWRNRRFWLPLMLSLGLGVWPAAGTADVTLTAPGADKGLAADLAGASLLLQAQRDNATDPQDLFTAARADYQRLLAALYAHGFYGPVIHILIDGREAASISPIDVPARISQIAITVDPGPAFRFSQARMKPYAPGTVLPPAYRDGRPALSTAIEDAGHAGVMGWRKLGYAKATVASQDITADHKTRTVESQLILSAGPKLRFGRLVIEGAENMTPFAITKISGYHEGDTFSPEVLEKMADRLRSAGTFRSLTIREAEKPTRDDRLDVLLTLKEEPLRRFGFGAEASSLDGTNLSAFWLHRNLFGGAERLRFDALASGVDAKSGVTDYKLGVRLERPATPVTDSSAFVTATFERQDDATSRTTTYSTGVGLTRTFSRTLTGTAELDYTHTTLTAGGVKQKYELISLPVTFKWDRRNDALEPTKGTYLSVGTTPFYGFGQTDSAVRLQVDARIYRTLPSNDRIIGAARLQFGTVTSGSLVNTPPDFLFLAGGSGSVRGYGFETVGVSATPPGGTPYLSGGRSMVALNLEVRGRVNSRIGAAVFYDAAYVSSGATLNGASTFASGVGAGIRYDTGFGPVRLDLAVPVGNAPDHGLKVYVGIGQSF
jgi:translocation and assembly module TamA